jgi:hypothetical protein
MYILKLFLLVGMQPLAKNLQQLKTQYLLYMRGDHFPILSPKPQNHKLYFKSLTILFTYFTAFIISPWFHLDLNICTFDI